MPDNRESTECAICRDEKTSFRTMKCGHKICTDCYDHLKKNSSENVRCPFCRKKDGDEKKPDNRESTKCARCKNEKTSFSTMKCGHKICTDCYDRLKKTSSENVRCPFCRKKDGDEKKHEGQRKTTYQAERVLAATPWLPLASEAKKVVTEITTTEVHSVTMATTSQVTVQETTKTLFGETTKVVSSRSATAKTVQAVSSVKKQIHVKKVTANTGAGLKTAAKKVCIIEGALFAGKTVVNLNEYSQGNITGDKCIKNIVTDASEHSTAAMGSVSGAAVGSAICPGIGTIVGGIAGGILGSQIGKSVGNRIANFFW